MSMLETLLEGAPPAPRAARTSEIGASREAFLFQRARWQMVATTLRQAFSEARFRAVVVGTVSVVFWVGLFVLFSEGFLFLRATLESPAVRAQTVQTIYNVLFLSLLAMLTLSSAIISYSNLFRGDEIAFLLTLPARTERIVIHKFQEAVVFSCWGFLLLGSPMLIAYGVTCGAPWYYYAMIFPFMLAFVLIPTGLGMLLCLLVVYFLPSLRMYAVLLVGGAALVAAGVWGWAALGSPAQDILTPEWFQQMLGRMRFAEQRLLPSWWLSSGLLEAAHPAVDGAGRSSWLDSLWFLVTLLTNALLMNVLVVEWGSPLFRQGYSGLQGLTRARRPARSDAIDRLLGLLTCWLPRHTSVIVIKDFRVFRRDPVQWSQFAIFFGLLMLYFINIRRFNYGAQLTQWMTMVGFMNVGVVGLILATFTTRFIFPMVSLEGRRFWILGTAPLERRTILWAKFLFAAGGAVIPCSSLIFLSDVMLRVVERTPVIAAIHQLACVVLCVGLSAMAVGLGARLPNMREPSPAKIAAGFGGTLNLMLNIVFIIAVVLLTAVPCYYWMEGAPQTWNAARDASGLGPWIGLGTRGAVIGGLAGTILLGALGTYLPLRLGMKAFERLEP